MTKDRKANLSRRTDLNDFRDNWQEAVTTLSQSPWHTGQNERKWRADADWFLKDDTNWAKALEQKESRQVRAEVSGERIRKEEEAILKRADEELARYDMDSAPEFIKKAAGLAGLKDMKNRGH